MFYILWSEISLYSSSKTQVLGRGTLVGKYSNEMFLVVDHQVHTTQEGCWLIPLCRNPLKKKNPSSFLATTWKLEASAPPAGFLLG